ncbi:thymidylate synthase [Aphanomyces invadans]|uniref:Bifunctional dihydrofolate reductase-thymidylate synthase n=1 Tax=Aphanomyces invadans TaxID=157072 RepID=A0A024TRZ0_9STRA|nr:thymidylate synthase [Aphanomyces invadans]ETV96381.1 thymidylate synthase [Aphanomyces invadans]|eukprot:XP_008875173.1 thymidylate synthase [Aphanomyces invadans]
MHEISVVVAVARKTWGIGIDNTLPWKLPSDMKRFREITTSTTDATKQNAVIMGRNTWESIPAKFRPLPGRLNVVLTRNSTLAAQLDASSPQVLAASSLDDALAKLSPTKIEHVFAIGGANVYSDALRHRACRKAYVTMVDGDFDCDAFFPSTLKQLGFVETEALGTQTENGIDFHFATFERKHEELQYLNLIQRILDEGIQKGDRTGTGTLSLFGAQMRFSLRDGAFPLLTTKRVFWKGVAEELLWFISGNTNAKTLQDKGIKIWDGNGSREYLDSIGLVHREEGDLGPVYGFQWRHFGATYVDMHTDYTGQGHDQLADVIYKIKHTPNDRRIILSAWNPADLGIMALPPCHMLCQFYVADGELSCQMYQRSADMGLGVPFNIASYALLTRMLAQVSGLQAGDFIHVIGDAHVYSNHVAPLLEQLKRSPRPFPRLHLNPAKTSIDEFTFDDFTLDGYDPHKTIKMDMSV